MYVDDSTMMGEDAALNKTEEDLNKYFTVTVEELKNYVGCDYLVTKKGINLHQPQLIQRIKEKFADELKDLPMKSTPATAGYTVGQMKEGYESRKENRRSLRAELEFAGI